PAPRRLHHGFGEGHGPGAAPGERRVRAAHASRGPERHLVGAVDTVSATDLRLWPRRFAVALTLATLAALAVPALLPTSAVASAKTHAYKPPFHKGAQGGDQFNYVYSDPSSGQVAVFRGYPIFNPFTCGGSRGGWVTLRVPMKTTSKVAAVE